LTKKRAPNPIRAVGIEIILPRKEVISMPIKWSAMQVMEAADTIEKHIDAAVEPLECAREVARAALRIPNLPGYVGQRFAGLLGEIGRAIGGPPAEPVGRLRARLQSIQDFVPKDDLEAEKKTSSYGDKVSLI
jgi:hypothetical protein